MGQQGTHTINGASVVVIDQACDNDQLLVSLSKNGAKWLSPVGWTDQQKVTLLDCRVNGETTEIDIPAEFAKDINSGDVLVLRCSELDLEKEITWEASEVGTRSDEELAPSAAGLASGLLSRFKSSKAEVIEETKSEAEIRAEEADRAAQNFKVKMEAATEAKEAAQRKALEAARDAEAALKMEADRIAEMERAAKAFEEAERLKQDEHRRVDEERRAEEARLAEEAWRIEDARKREIAAKKDAERKAALERYEAALDITRNEELRLKARLKDLKHQATAEAANNAVQTEDLKSRQGLLVNTEETASRRFDSYETSASKLDVMTADLSLLQSESETLTADRQAISIRLSQADTEYQQAQQDAEVAIARAEARRSALDNIRLEESDVSGQISSVSEKLASQNQLVADEAQKTQKLQSKLQAAQSELAQAKAEIDALEQALAGQGEKDQTLRLEIEATHQAVEDSQARESAHRNAIMHLEAGGAPEDIAEIAFETRNLEPSSFSFDTSEGDLSPAKIEGLGFKDRMMGRVRRNFAREKEAEISIDVDDVVLEAAELDADPVLLAGLDNTPSFVRRYGSSLKALGAVIGGIAIMGGGYAINKSANQVLEVKSSTPVPTQVASAVTKVELPNALDLKEVETKVVNALVETAPLKIEIPKIETVGIEPINTVEVETETPPVIETSLSEAERVIEEAMTPAEAEEKALIVKLAEVVDPTGFAFELPDMMPKVQVKKAQTKPAAIKAKVEKLPVKTVSIKKTEPKKVEIKTSAAPKVEAVVNYPELTSDVQTRLLTLGFYTGEIDGLLGQETKDAITNFKTLFSMPVDDRITGALLTELKKAERDQEAVQQQAEHDAALKAEQEAIQFVEAAPSVGFFDTQHAVPSTPVVTDSLPAATDIIPVSDSLPPYIARVTEPVKVASIPTVIEPAPTPVAQDVIIEAKVLKKAIAKYPSIAARRNHFVDAAIVVGYDIDETGTAANITIKSNDNSGRYSEAFEKEAVKAIEKLSYEPKTVNGVAVVTPNKEKRIVFRAG